jgi:hypothetical protein
MLVQFFQENLSIKLDYTLCPFGINWAFGGLAWV